MLQRKGIDAALACVSAVRTLSTALQELRNASAQLIRGHNADHVYIHSAAQQTGDPLPGASDAAGWQRYPCCSPGVWDGNPTGVIGGGHFAIGRQPTCQRTGCIPNIPTGDLATAARRHSGPALSVQLQPQRTQHTRVGHLAGKGGGGGDGRAGGSSSGQQQPRRRRPRFKSSPKIMNTASLWELGDLAAAEVAGWKPKELAAAARRAVSLWRHEQPEAAERVRLTQRLPLLPTSMSHHRGAEKNVAGGTGGGNGGQVHAGGLLRSQELLSAGAGGSVRSERLEVTPEKERPTGQMALERAHSSAIAHPVAVAAAAVAPGEAAAAEVVGAAPEVGAHRSAPAGRKLTGGAFRTAVVNKPLRPHELRLAQLVERLVRAANGRLAEGFGSRELSSFVWSLVSLGYWQPPLLPLVSAFADYGAERLRSADPIAMAMLLQVLAKSRAASMAGQSTATRLLELAPTTAAAAAESLPRCLPSCEPRTLAGLLHSCAVLLSPGPRGSQGPGLEGPHLAGRTADALAALARDVAKECLRRRFIGFGPSGLLTAAGALTALRRVPAGDGVVGGGEEAWAMLAAAAVSPLAPQMAAATPRQWALLLRIAEGRGGSSYQLLTAGAISAGALADPTSGGHESGLSGMVAVSQ